MAPRLYGYEIIMQASDGGHDLVDVSECLVFDLDSETGIVGIDAEKFLDLMDAHRRDESARLRQRIEDYGHGTAPQSVTVGPNEHIISGNPRKPLEKRPLCPKGHSGTQKSYGVVCSTCQTVWTQPEDTKPCLSCGGSGYYTSDRVHTCRECGGNGKAKGAYFPKNEAGNPSRPCHQCTVGTTEVSETTGAPLCARCKVWLAHKYGTDPRMPGCGRDEHEIESMWDGDQVVRFCTRCPWQSPRPRSRW